MCMGPKGMQASRVTGPKGVSVVGDHHVYREMRAKNAAAANGGASAVRLPSMPVPVMLAHPSMGGRMPPNMVAAAPPNARRQSGDRANTPPYPAMQYYPHVYVMNNGQPYYDMGARPSSVQFFPYPIVRTSRRFTAFCSSAYDPCSGVRHAGPRRPDHVRGTGHDPPRKGRPYFVGRQYRYVGVCGDHPNAG